MDNDQLVKQCLEEYKKSLDFKQGRITDWHNTEDQYAGKVKKTLKSRFNAPLPIMSGFEHTLLSKIDEPPSLKFETDQESEEKATKKVQAFYENISTRDDYDWELLDLDGKKQAIKYGRTVYRCYGESDPKFRFNLELVDIYDFYFDPMGGADLERHRFLGFDNIFKDKYDLIEQAKAGDYDRSQVQKLLTATEPLKPNPNDNIYLNKQNRLASLNLDSISYNYAGKDQYKFIEGFTIWKGKRFKCLFNAETGIWLKAIPLIEDFESELWPAASWAPYRDPFNFLSLAPADEIRPIAEIMRVLANQELDNRNKINYGMRAYDPDVFPEPAQLEWRPDGLVAVKSGSASVQGGIERGIYSFKTEHFSGTIDIVNWLDDMLGRKSGVTAGAQGQSDESKVGIYLGNIQQVADRLGLQNKYYRKCWSAIGKRFLHAVDEHLTGKQAVKLIGENGVEWDELRAREVSTEWGIRVVGGSAQQQADAIKQKQQVEVLTNIAANPQLVSAVSSRWLIEQNFRAVGFLEEDIRMAFDKENEGNREILQEAAMAIEDIVNGKAVKPNRGANTAFVQKIMDYAYDHDLKTGVFEKLIAYAQAHLQTAAENMARKAVLLNAQKGVMPQATSPVDQLMNEQPQEGIMPQRPQPQTQPNPMPI
jgi:hypothetical protein